MQNIENLQKGGREDGGSFHLRVGADILLYFCINMALAISE